MFPSFEPHLYDSSDYATLLHLNDHEATESALARVLATARSCPGLASEVDGLFSQGWREHLVAAVAVWSDPRPAMLESLWLAFDQGSWAAPQLAVTAWMCDPSFEARARKRILLGCPLLPHPRRTHMSGPEIHVLHGPGGERSAKNQASLWTLLAFSQEGRQWLQERITMDQAVQVLLIDDAWDRSPQVVASWGRKFPELLERLGETVERRLHGEPPDLLDLWQAHGPEWLMQGGVLKGLVEPFLRAGADALQWTPEGSDDVIRAEGVAAVRLQSPWNRVARYHLRYDFSSGMRRWDEWLLKLEGSLEAGQPFRVQVSKWREGRVRLSRQRLEEVQAEVLAYGCDDTGRLQGGAGAALLELAGPSLQEALSMELAESGREIGTMVCTNAYGLRQRGVRSICHIVSLDASAGRCNRPEQLRKGVLAAVRRASREGSYPTLALTALATGGGGVDPRRVARLTLEAIQQHFDQDSSDLQVVLCLPAERDYKAFQEVLAPTDLGLNSSLG